MTQPQNLADLARLNYGTQYWRCVQCGVVVYPNGADWRDGSGQAWCWNGATQHSGRMEGTQR